MDLRKDNPKIKWENLTQIYNEKFNRRKKSFLLRNRVLFLSNPGIKKYKLTNEEKILIFEGYRKYGAKWSLISNHVPFR